MLNAAELIGKVVDATGGPLYSATVELRREGDRAVIRSFFTDHSGVFRFTDLNAGTYQLAFSCPGFHLAQLTRTVSREERVALLDTVLQLAPIENCVEPDWGPPGILSSEIDSGTELTGKAEEHGGTPVREAVVILTNGNNSYRTSSGPTGAFHAGPGGPARTRGSAPRFITRAGVHKTMSYSYLKALIGSILAARRAGM